jgi:hypothetical protein
MLLVVLLLASCATPTRINCPALTLNVTEPVVVSCCWLMPPASKQVPQPEVFVTVEPDAAVFTRLPHEMAVPLAGVVVEVDVEVDVDVDVEVDEVDVEICAFWTLAPIVSRLVSIT